MALPFVKDGWGLDRALAAMFFGAKAGETVSVMAARAQLAGKPWGCSLCALLSAIVQPDHCAQSLGSQPTPLSAALRAGVLLVVVAVALWVMPAIAAWAFL